MAFILYERQGAQNLIRISDVELSGKSGLLANVVRERAAGRLPPFQWRLSETEILISLGRTNPDQYVLMLDLKPSQKKKVSLGRVREIRGVSQQMRTSICVYLEICVDTDCDDAAGLKELIALEPGSSFDTAVEFLELNGGIAEQRWTWAPIGRLNAPVMTIDALNYFARAFEKDAPEPATAMDGNFDFERMRLDLEELFGARVHDQNPAPAWNITEQPLESIPPAEDGSRLPRFLSASRDTVRRFFAYARTQAARASNLFNSRLP
jgi:hypothetical protein